eukprot:jgi/Bigna1/64879/fgenesh1_kg.88_\
MAAGVLFAFILCHVEGVIHNTPHRRELVYGNGSSSKGCNLVKSTTDGKFHMEKEFEDPVKHCLTGPPAKDGFGAHYTLFMTAVAFAAKNRITYCHTPGSHVAHAQDNDQLKILMGFKAGNCSKCDREKHGYFHWVNEDPEAYYTPCVRNYLREKYDAGVETLNLQSTFGRDENTTVIAVHIRRGDIDEETNHGNRYVKMSAFERGLEMIRKDYLKPREVHVFHVFSEGSPEDFKILTKHDDVELQLLGDDGMMTSFHSMVTADYLLTSPSSFSYAAGVLSKGKVFDIYPIIVCTDWRKSEFCDVRISGF